MDDKAIILFDGVCNLCNGWVDFVIERDPDGRFLFAPLQSEEAARVLDQAGQPEVTDSIILVAGDEVLQKSDAALYIANRLDSAWRHATVLRFVPRFVRDMVYDFVANNRYDWFGKRETCRAPSPEVQSRFLQTGNVSSTDT